MIALPSVPPRFRPPAAPFSVQQPEWFQASVGKRRWFQSMRDVLAYEDAFRAWTPDAPAPAEWFSPAWLGHQDAAELQGDA
jgi:hypothetical protein